MFNPVQGVSFADFVEANREVDAWLKLQPGFRSRRIAEEHYSSVVDVLIRDFEAAARTAMHRLMDELADSQVHALIEHATVSWTVAEIRHKHEIDD